MPDVATRAIRLCQLHLSTMAACFDDINERALAGGWSIRQTLARFCEREPRGLLHHTK